MDLFEGCRLGTLKIAVPLLDFKSVHRTNVVLVQAATKKAHYAIFLCSLNDLVEQLNSRIHTFWCRRDMKAPI